MPETTIFEPNDDCIDDYGDDDVDEHVMIDTFALNELLPSNTSAYFRYNGSLTTPPCYQSVIWTVYKQPISISAYQV